MSPEPRARCWAWLRRWPTRVRLHWRVREAAAAPCPWWSLGIGVVGAWCAYLLVGRVSNTRHLPG